MPTAMVYGAYGYTGRLITELAVAQGLKPIVAGRNADAARKLGEEFGLEHRGLVLDDVGALDRAMQAVDVVVHCAGPFAHTAEAMAEACLRNKVHYLDITGEIIVFEQMAARDAIARKAGVMLMPGTGFDVVPSDCLAMYLKEKLPDATALELAFQAVGKPSRGTATTMVENLPKGGAVRRQGIIKPVPAAWQRKAIDFGEGPRDAMSIPWGDVSTAFHSTGIPDITVYMAAPKALQRQAMLARYIGPLLGLGAVQNYMKKKIQEGPPGPTPEHREKGYSLLWGEATNANGEKAAARLRTPEGYKLTAMTSVGILKRVLGGEAPAGFQTPAKAYGSGLIMEFDGVTREDL